MAVIVDENMSWSSGLACRVYDATPNCSMYVYSDGTDYEAVGSPSYTANSRLSVKNQIKFCKEEPASCPKPSGLTASNITGTSATISWSGNASHYNLRYKASNATTWTTINNLSATTYSLSDLALNTTYDVEVTAVCSATDESDPRSAQFTTDPCNNMCSISYSLSDSYGDGWNGNAIQVIDLSDNSTIATLTIEDGSSASGTLTICANTDIQLVWVTGSYIGETSFTIYGTDNEVILQGAGSEVDAVTYSVCPTCPRPTNLTAGTPDAHNVQLSWTPNGEENQWQICVNGDESNPILVNTNPYTLTDLAGGTSYNVKVRAYCEANDQSGWSNTVYFTTEEVCPRPTDVTATEIMPTSVTLEWEGTETGRVRYGQLGSISFFEDFENGLGNFTTIDNDGDGYNWYTYSGNTDNYGNPTSLDYQHVTSASYDGYALTPDNWLVSPLVELGGSLSVWLRGQDPEWAAEHFAIYLSTTGNTVSDFLSGTVWLLKPRPKPFIQLRQLVRPAGLHRHPPLQCYRYVPLECG